MLLEKLVLKVSHLLVQPIKIECLKQKRKDNSSDEEVTPVINLWAITSVLEEGLRSNKVITFTDKHNLTYGQPIKLMLSLLHSQVSPTLNIENRYSKSIPLFLLTYHPGLQSHSPQTRLPLPLLQKALSSSYLEYILYVMQVTL